MQKRTKKSAFTLIELSMVLIIIGILISGIYTGRGMIRNSQMFSARALTLNSQISSIPGMVAWYETTTTDSFDASEISDGSTITTWYNRAADGFLEDNNLTGVTGGGYVGYISQGINNLPSVEFDSSGYFRLSSFSGS